MPEPVYDVTTERIYLRFPEFYRVLDSQNDYQLKTYLSGITGQLDEINVLAARLEFMGPERQDYNQGTLNEYNTYVRPDGIENPVLGWAPVTETSDLFDSRTADSEWLTFIAQCVGVNAAEYATDLALRQALYGTYASYRAGSLQSLELATKNIVTDGNLLEKNVATGTDTLGTTTGFIGRTSVTLSSDGSGFGLRAGTKTLKVTNTSSVTGGFSVGATANTSTATTIPANGTIQIVAGEEYTFSVGVQGNSATTLPSLRPTIYWWTPAGNVAASTASTAGTATALTGDPQTIELTATAPGNAKYASVELVQTTAVGTVYWAVDELFFSKAGVGENGAGIDFVRVYQHMDETLAFSSIWDILIVTKADETPSNLDVVAELIGIKPAGVDLHHLAYSGGWGAIELTIDTWTKIEAVGSWDLLEMGDPNLLPA